jgi:hypothetical protein
MFLLVMVALVLLGAILIVLPAVLPFVIVGAIVMALYRHHQARRSISG